MSSFDMDNIPLITDNNFLTNHAKQTLVLNKDLTVSYTIEYLKTVEIKNVDILKHSVVINDLIKLDKKFHPVIEWLTRCYDEHISPVFTPDLILWIILTEFSKVVNSNPEKYRSVLVEHAGKETIEIVSSNLLTDEHIIPTISKIFVDKITNMSLKDSTVANFTTTNVNVFTACNIATMDTYKEFYDYEFTTKCGFPSIIVEGVVEDWIKLKTKVTNILNLLKVDSTKILNIIENFTSVVKSNNSSYVSAFINIFKSNNLTNIFNNMFRLNNASGYTNRFDGWIKDIFFSCPKIVDSSSIEYTYSKVPLIWNYRTERLNLTLMSGIMGLHYNKDENSLSPEFGYVLAKDSIVDFKF